MLNFIIWKMHELFGLSESIRKNRVEIAHQKFLNSLQEVEANPLDRAKLNKCRQLGFDYQILSSDLGIEVNRSKDGLDITKDISIAQFRGLRNSNLQKNFESKNEINSEEIMVVICGNWGDIAMTLTEWIKNGPGIRFLRHPIRAWNMRTGEELSVEDIPIQYRNNEDSRRKIEAGEIPNPWDFETDY